MFIKKVKHFISDDSGIAAVFVTLGLVVIMGCAALVIDAGMLYSARMKASNAVDAAVLAGVWELPNDPGIALSVAQSYAQANGVDPSEVTFTIEYNDAGQASSITGDVDTDMNLFFARVLGINTGDVKAHAKARVGPAASIDGSEGMGIIPYGILEPDVVSGTEIVIREGAGVGDTGWYGFLDLEPVSFPVNQNLDMCEYIEDGYPGVVYITDEDHPPLDASEGAVDTQPWRSLTERIESCVTECGHDPECTWDDYVPGCPRLVVVPVGEISDDTKLFTVTGFALLFLQYNTDFQGNEEVTGFFLEPYVVSGEINDDPDAPCYGVYACELCE